MARNDNDKDAHKVAHNASGLPDAIRSGIEAKAFTQGTDIHLAPGQEKHLAHEAWHVVQQKQGRVQAGMGNGDGPAGQSDAQRLEVRAQLAAKNAESPGTG